MATEPTRGVTLTHNAAALTVGRLGSKLLVFLLVRFYTYVLTKEQFGTADLISSVANLLIPLACAGLSSGFFRFAAEAKSEREQTDVFSTGVLILIASSLVFALISPLITLVPFLGSYALILLLYVLCANLHYLVSDFVRAQGRYQLFALQGLLNTALNIAFNLIFLLPLSMGVEGYILSIVVADLITSVVLIVACRLWRYVRLRSVQRRQLGAMLRFSLPLIPATVCWWITNASDRYMVTYFCGEAANGLYAAAYKIPNLLVIAGGIFTDAWQFSAVVENRRAENAETEDERRIRHGEMEQFFTNVFSGYSGFLCLAAAGMMLLCRPMAAILFDPTFVEAWRFVPVLLLATVLSALSSFVSSVYLVERRGQAILVTSLIGALCNVVLNLSLIPPMGALGAAIATAVSYLAVLIVRLLHSRRHIRFGVSPVRLLVNLIALVAISVVMSIELSGWIWYTLALCCVVAVISAQPLLRALRGFLNGRRAASGKKD
ncbi:MAG: polysaccharide biosynthesis C-terminal domain-containing protein [Clostridia bacterium]|nr:polysaccharide biosynthesis C-terminal domain-containing protein [Clostridia bacterium]